MYPRDHWHQKQQIAKINEKVKSRQERVGILIWEKGEKWKKEREEKKLMDQKRNTHASEKIRLNGFTVLKK